MKEVCGWAPVDETLWQEFAGLLGDASLQNISLLATQPADTKEPGSNSIWTRSMSGRVRQRPRCQWVVVVGTTRSQFVESLNLWAGEIAHNVEVIRAFVPLAIPLINGGVLFQENAWYMERTKRSCPTLKSPHPCDFHVKMRVPAGVRSAVAKDTLAAKVQQRKLKKRQSSQ